MTLATSELILGGQKSGKSRRAELLARDWLAMSPEHRALLIATAQPWDDEMRARIARHQQDRAQRVPGLATLEEPHDLATAITRHGAAHTLIVVDCLTLWLTNHLMPLQQESKPNRPPAHDWQAQAAIFFEAMRGPAPAAGPAHRTAPPGVRRRAAARPAHPDGAASPAA